MTQETKTDWEIAREAIRKERAKAMRDLTPEQLEAIQKTHDQLRRALDCLRECDDLWLSDIRELNDCWFQLHQNFNFCPE